MLQDIPAVWSRAPPGVRIMHQQPAQCKLLVLGDEVSTVGAQKTSNVVRMKSFGTGRTLHVDAALHDLYSEVAT